jgi:hypothetical protein
MSHGSLRSDMSVVRRVGVHVDLLREISNLALMFLVVPAYNLLDSVACKFHVAEKWLFDLRLRACDAHLLFLSHILCLALRRRVCKVNRLIQCAHQQLRKLDAV